MLDGVHGEAGEGLDIRVPVVQSVNMHIKWPKVDESVGEIEVNVSPQGGKRESCGEAEHACTRIIDGRVTWTTGTQVALKERTASSPKGCSIRLIRETARSPEEREHVFEYNEDCETRGAPEHIVPDLVEAVDSALQRQGVTRPCRMPGWHNSHHPRSQTADGRTRDHRA